MFVVVVVDSGMFAVDGGGNGIGGMFVIDGGDMFVSGSDGLLLLLFVMVIVIFVVGGGNCYVVIGYPCHCL